MAIFTSRALRFLLPNFSFQWEGAQRWGAFRSHTCVCGVSLGEKEAGSCFGNITPSGHPASSSPCQQSPTLSLISDMFAKKGEASCTFLRSKTKREEFPNMCTQEAPLCVFSQPRENPASFRQAAALGAGRISPAVRHLADYVK